MAEKRARSVRRAGTDENGMVIFDDGGAVKSASCECECGGGKRRGRENENEEGVLFSGL